MSAQTPEVQKKPAEVLKDLATAIDELRKGNDEVKKELTEVKSKQLTPNYTAGIIGSIPGDSQPYSIMKMAAYSAGLIDREHAKYEADIGDKLTALYKSCGWSKTIAAGHRSFVAPYCTAMLPTHNSEGDRLVGEFKHKMIGGGASIDQDEVNWLPQDDEECRDGHEGSRDHERHAGWRFGRVPDVNGTHRHAAVCRSFQSGRRDGSGASAERSGAIPEADEQQHSLLGW